MLKTTRRKIYGNTWWGHAWVAALERIDTNRLARGKTYANTGRVLKLSVENGQVSAQVKGSYYDSYRINIRLTPFNRNDIKVIQALIARQPSLALELGTGSLPPALLDLLRDNGLVLLPARWKDIQSSCSCPDWMNPCKHLAAVYYILANEIDKDPFVLFNLKGMATVELLQAAQGAGTSTEAVRQNPVLARFVDPATLCPPEARPLAEGFDFAFPPRKRTPLLSLLADNPPFYLGGNFKEFLESLYRFVPGEAARLYDPCLHEAAVLADRPWQLELVRDEFSPRHLFRIKFGVDETVESSIDKETVRTALNSVSTNRSGKTHQPADSARLFESRLWHLGGHDGRRKPAMFQSWSVEPAGPALDYLLTASLDVELDEASDGFLFLNLAAAMALALVKSGQFLPDVVFEDANTFFIRYVPYLHEPAAARMAEHLQALMLWDMAHYEDRFLPSDALSELLAFFITHIVHQALQSVDTIRGDRITPLFTQGMLFRASKFTETSVGPSIANWLEKLHLGKRDVAPVLRIEEAHQADAFHLSVDVCHRRDALAGMLPLAQLFAEPVGKRTHAKHAEVFGQPVDAVRTDVSRQLIMAAQTLPELMGILDSRGKESPVLTLTRMSEVLSSVAGVLAVLGIDLILPKALQKLATPALQVRGKLRKSNETGNSYLSLDAMLQFSYEIALGDETLSPQEFRGLVKQTGGLVRFRDQYVLLRPDEARSILDRLKKPLPEPSSPMQALYATMTGEIGGIRFEPDAAIQRLLADFRKAEDVAVPTALNATLRPYQERGFRWLWGLAAKGFGCCIADDMGLGKTIQLIALLLHARQANLNSPPSLVVCPTTLIGNWEKECAKFAPGLNVSIYHGAERQLKYKGIDLVITSYGTFRRDLEKFNAKPWEFLIIDEAQNIKNSDTAQTKALKSLRAKTRIAMTGTPVENRLTELWSIFDFINPGYLGSLSHFKTEIANPIEKARDAQVIEKFQRATAPFILRRLKTDKRIIADLPDKISFDEYCHLTPAQAAVYQNVVEATMRLIETSEGIERKGLIFRLITQLKQICNHPAHFADQGAIASDLSGKAAKTKGILQTLLENREKALIFTQYREMGDLLSRIIADELHVAPLFFHGGLTRKQRDAMVLAFQEDPRRRLMILSLKAGGTGLNLTAASSVIHYDLWWNPAVENQATDRAYRIGQDKKVIVHRLITLGTFEEKIDEMIKAKQALADLAVGAGEQWVTELSNAELRDIFSLGREKR